MWKSRMRDMSGGGEGGEGRSRKECQEKEGKREGVVE